MLGFSSGWVTSHTLKATFWNWWSTPLISPSVFPCSALSLLACPALETSPRIRPGGPSGPGGPGGPGGPLKETALGRQWNRCGGRQMLSPICFLRWILMKGMFWLTLQVVMKVWTDVLSKSWWTLWTLWTRDTWGTRRPLRAHECLMPS